MRPLTSHVIVVVVIAGAVFVLIALGDICLVLGISCLVNMTRVMKAMALETFILFMIFMMLRIEVET